MNVYLLFIFFFAVFTGAFLLNNILLQFSSNLGIRNNKVSILRWSDQSKPSMGGIGFYLIFLLSTLFYFSLDALYGFSVDFSIFGIVFGASLAFGMGLSDDAYNTTPYIKFLAQVFCALVLIFFEVYIDFFQMPILNYLLTILWVVGIMNSINMLDNMDAIVSVVALNILGFCSVVAFLESGISYVFICAIATVASMLAFLYYNWSPSKMFMGDAGSQFLGFFLSVLGIKFVWNVSLPDHSYVPAALVFLVFLLPITDTLTVSINRLRKGSSPFVGGKDHTTHHLCYAGFSERKVALLFWVLSAFSCFSSVLVYMNSTNTLVFAFVLSINIVIALAIYSVTIRYKDPLTKDINKMMKKQVKRSLSFQSETLSKQD